MPTAAGFGDLETTLQYQLFKDPAHETAMLLGLIVDWGGTGATGAGTWDPLQRDHANVLFRPGIWTAPGHRRLAAAGGDHRSDRLQIRPVPMTPPQAVNIPQSLVYGASLQYSMPYLKSEVKDLQLPEFVNHLIPIVEMQF